MTDRFRNKYRIESTRLQNWDYQLGAAYFITICTQNKLHYFGEIVDSQMQLSAIGKIAENEWIKTFEMRPDMNLLMDTFIIMPNHFHAIIVIGDNKYNIQCHTDARHCTQRDARHCMLRDAKHCMLRDARHCVSTDKPQNKFGPQRKNLSSIIRGYKIGVTKNARLIDPNFAWQARFHDHIIRNNESYEKIHNYIIENPENWDHDKYST